MAIELARVIADNGGSIFINARVKEIIVSDAGRVQGVMMDDVDRTIIKSKRVVSGAGYATTFRSLINKAVVSKLEIPESLKVPQSAGFVMVNIGMKATAEEVGAETSNTWHIPVDDNDDAFAPMRRYFSSPTNVGMGMPAFITFPSCKDKKWSSEHPGRVSCQMLFMAEYDWFKQFTGPDRKSATAAQYNSIKDEWKASALKVFYKYYPKVSTVRCDIILYVLWCICCCVYA
jgi:all-trans-retinol 13,14-reductase